MLALSGCGGGGSSAADSVPEGTGVGQRAPALAGRDSSGAEVRLDGRQERAVVVFFQGAECGLCREQLSALQSHLPAYRHLGAHVMAATPADAAELGGLVQLLRLEYAVVSVDSATVARWELAGQGAGPVRPATFVLRDGRVVFRHVGSNGSDRATDAALLTVLENLESD